MFSRGVGAALTRQRDRLSRSRALCPALSRSGRTVCLTLTALDTTHVIQFHGTLEIPTDPPVQYTGEAADTIAITQPIWNILPAPELRALKLNSKRHLRNPEVKTFKRPEGTQFSAHHKRTFSQSSAVVNFAWYPGASSSNAPAYCFVASVRDCPVKLLDALDGRLRASYPIIDRRERFIAPHSLAFNLILVDEMKLADVDHPNLASHEYLSATMNSTVNVLHASDDDFKVP
ncbi:hypothetical protein F4604DRAFT_1923443 [Suillus subluteus]|nr:hypothetical protein F4604DRAFT_1923443 [Suillus subluteus]